MASHVGADVLVGRLHEWGSEENGCSGIDLGGDRVRATAVSTGDCLPGALRGVCHAGQQLGGYSAWNRGESSLLRDWVRESPPRCCRGQHNENMARSSYSATVDVGTHRCLSGVLRLSLGSRNDGCVPSLQPPCWLGCISGRGGTVSGQCIISPGSNAVRSP